MRAFTLTFSFFALLITAKPVFAFPESCPTGSAVLQMETGEAASGVEATEATRYLSTVLAEAIARTAVGRPVVRLIAMTGHELAEALGRHHGSVSFGYSLVRACGGGIVTYMGLTAAGDGNVLTDWWPKLVTSVVTALINAGWMKGNQISQAILDFEPFRLLGKVLPRPLRTGIPAAFGWVGDRLTNVAASLGIEFSFEGPKQGVASWLMPAGHFKANLKDVLSVVTLGQGLWEIGVAKRTRLKKAMTRDLHKKMVIQTVSDLMILAGSLATTFAVGMKYVHAEGGNSIFNTMIALGVLVWFDTFISPFLVPQTTSCGEAISEAPVMAAGALAGGRARRTYR